jgi:hypothetical protein
MTTPTLYPLPALGALGALPTSGLHNWLGANQSGASTTVVADGAGGRMLMHEISRADGSNTSENGGSIGARAFWTHLGKWDQLKPLMGMVVEFPYRARFNLSVRQGAGNFCTCGIEAKANPNSGATVQVNVETLDDGFLRYWLGGVGGTAQTMPPRAVIAPNVWHDVLLRLFLDPVNGWAELVYGDDVVRADAIETISPDGICGLGWCLYSNALSDSDAHRASFQPQSLRVLTP